MTDNEIYETIREIILDTADLESEDELQDDSRLGYIMDEIELIDVISQIESIYDFDLSYEEFEEYEEKTVKDLVELVKEKAS